MPARIENRPGATGPERPPIRTTDAAAQRIEQLYKSLKAVAVPATRDYLRSRLNGPEGGTWNSFDLGFPTGLVQVPQLPPVTDLGGKIMLGATYQREGNIWAPVKLRHGLRSLPNGQEVPSVTLTRGSIGNGNML